MMQEQMRLCCLTHSDSSLTRFIRDFSEISERKLLDRSL